jgi:hypothetical protein
MVLVLAEKVTLYFFNGEVAGSFVTAPVALNVDK